MKQTSREAYERVKPKIKKRHVKIMEVLNTFPNSEMTSFDISQKCDLPYAEVSRRMSEIVRLGKAEETERDPEQKRMKYKLSTVNHLEVEFEEVN